MNLSFLGTGAADWDWQTYPAGVRGSTMTLVNDRLLLDAGPSLLRNMALYGISPEQTEAVMITHSHSDHFQVEQLRLLASRHPIDVYCSSQAGKRLSGIPGITAHALEVGQKLTLCGLDILVLPANHSLEDLREQAFHYLICEGKKKLLYHLDGGWMTAVERDWLKKTDPFMELDAIVWDATSGNTFQDWRFPYHNDLKMIDDMRIGLAKTGLVSDKTVHIFNHIARTLWPESASEREELAQKYRGVLAEDGGIFTI